MLNWCLIFITSYKCVILIATSMLQAVLYAGIKIISTILMHQVILIASPIKHFLFLLSQSVISVLNTYLNIEAKFKGAFLRFSTCTRNRYIYIYILKHVRNTWVHFGRLELLIIYYAMAMFLKTKTAAAGCFDIRIAHANY